MSLAAGFETVSEEHKKSGSLLCKLPLFKTNEVN